MIQIASVRKNYLIIEEYTENIDEAKLVKKTSTELHSDKNENKDKCNSYVVYKVLFWIFFILFIISIGIGVYFVYCKYVNSKKYDLPY